MKNHLIMVAMVAALAALPIAATEAQAPVPGWNASSAYWEGEPPRIQVTVRHSSERDRVTRVELVSPEGDIIATERIDSQTFTETTGGSYSPGPSVGIGIGGYGGSGGATVGTGIGLGFPLGGGGSSGGQTVFKERRADAEIVLSNASHYRINWSFYKIRITVERDDGTRNVAVIEAPRP